MSNSQFQSFLNCEAKAMAKLEGKYIQKNTTCILVGKYVHAWCEGVLPEFIEDNPSIFKKNSEELLQPYRVANDIIRKIEKTPPLMKALKGQKEKIFTAQLFGIPWKICIDTYNPDAGYFSDLKILRTLSKKSWNNKEHMYVNFLENDGYLSQMALYCEIERLASNRKTYLDPHLVVLTKEDPINMDIISFNRPEEPLDIFVHTQMNYIENHLERILAVKNKKTKPNRCNFCDYCIDTKVITETTHYTYYNPY